MKDIFLRLSLHKTCKYNILNVSFFRLNVSCVSLKLFSKLLPCLLGSSDYYEKRQKQPHYKLKKRVLKWTVLFASKLEFRSYQERYRA